MLRFGENKISFSGAGLFITEERWIHPQRTEVTYEIICVVEGRVHLEEEGELYELEKGEIIILKPGIMHRGYQYSDGATSFYWVHFFADSFDALEIPERRINNFNDIALFGQLLHIANTHDYPHYSIEAILLLILGELSRCKAQLPGKDFRVVRSAAEWIRINSLKKLKVKDVAARYGYNCEHFSRMFRSIFNVGLKEFIYTERMKQARSLLVNSVFSVKQIAQIMGFDDENRFVHFFKYHQKTSPAKFRNSVANMHMNRE